MLPEITVGSVHLSSFLLVWLCMFVYAAFRLRISLRHIDVDERYAYVFILVVMVFGGLGANLFDMAKYIVLHPRSSLLDAYRRSGLGSFGMIIGGFGAAVVALRLAHLPVLKILDACAPLLIIATAAGRFGCFLAGDGCYGPSTDLPWGIAFPHGVVPTSLPVHPTPLYEIVALVPVYFMVMKSPPQQMRVEGFSFIYALFLTNAVRIVMEFWRSSMYSLRIGGMTVEQIMAILFTIGTGLLLLRMNRSMHQPRV